MSEPHGILGHDPDLARKLLASFVDVLRWLSLFGLLSILILDHPMGISRIYGFLLVLLGSFFFQYLLKKNQLALVSHMLLTTLFLALLPGIALRGVTMAGSFLILASIPLAAILLGLRFGLFYCALNLGTLALYFQAQRLGWVVPREPSTISSWAVLEISVALLVAVYQSIPINGLFSALQMAKNEERELELVIARQEAENRNLAIMVGLRTQGLQEANQSLTRLSASLSHDLRAPLRSISGFTKILGESPIPDSVRTQLQGISSDIESLQLILEKTMLNLRRENKA